jgi:Domain of unknown function (DUF4149)
VSVVRSISLLFLGLWLGAAVFFSGVVAPAAFSVLRSFQIPNYAEIAGAIVNRSLGVINTSGFLVGALVLLFAFALRSGFSRMSFALETLSLGTMLAMTGLGQWVIAARMRALRSAMAAVPIDQIDLDDPRRIAFNSLHRYSVSALAIAIIAALIAYVLFARTSRTN